MISLIDSPSIFRGHKSTSMDTVSSHHFDIQALPKIPIPGRVLLTTPEHFRVAYVINPHMEGNIGTVDRDLARQQWNALKEAYSSIGIEVEVIQGAEGMPDMVFCANQSLPYRTPGGMQGVLLSRMNAPQRKDEVPFYETFFRGKDYEIHHLDDDLPGDFEGMGDAIWHPGRYLLWGGYGYRTDRGVYDRLSEELGIPVLTLQLTDPEFYHLDTCFCPLDEDTVLIYPDAFQPEGLELVHAHFGRILEAPDDEARGLFACNAHCPDGKHVIIQTGCIVTNRLLKDAGFDIIEVDTSEYLKSGGSVFCMKLMFW